MDGAYMLCHVNIYDQLIFMLTFVHMTHYVYTNQNTLDKIWTYALYISMTFLYQ